MCSKTIGTEEQIGAVSRRPGLLYHLRKAIVPELPRVPSSELLLAECYSQAEEETDSILTTQTRPWKHQHYNIPWCEHPQWHEKEYPCQHHHQQSQQDTWLPPAQPKDQQQGDKGNFIQSPCNVSWPTPGYKTTVWDPHTEREDSATEKDQHRAARRVSNQHCQTSSLNNIMDSLERPTL